MVDEGALTMSHIRSVLPDAAFPLSHGELPGARPRVIATRPPWREALGRWLRRLREREEMLALSERERRDAGITAYDVAFEHRKWPWHD
jgi:uncharacterized protein YjiS (DUF1127 family)